VTKDQAEVLQSVVDDVLSDAFEKRKEIGGAVNWADLLCTDVSVSLLTGLVTVTIEEVGPDGAQRLREFVSAELERRGFPDVYVLTEW
jgi:hypothetical protein